MWRRRESGRENVFRQMLQRFFELIVMTTMLTVWCWRYEMKFIQRITIIYRYSPQQFWKTIGGISNDTIFDPGGDILTHLRLERRSLGVFVPRQRITIIIYRFPPQQPQRLAQAAECHTNTARLCTTQHHAVMWKRQVFQSSSNVVRMSVVLTPRDVHWTSFSPTSVWRLSPDVRFPASAGRRSDE